MFVLINTISMIRLVILFIGVGVALAFKIKTEPSCGEEASSNLIHQNPWTVYLEYWNNDNRIDIRCTASLIDSRHLITAAHCIIIPKFTRLVARLGEYDLTTVVDCVGDICSPQVVRLQVIDVVVHPDYDGKDHDIAILKLESDAPYTDFIRPVCLPKGELEPKITFAASGFGELPRQNHYSSTKKIILLPLWEREACQIAYKKYPVASHVICAGGIEGIDTCRGDSGGPLVWVRDKVELWGVTSAGSVHCGTKDLPGIYTNVANHLEWILTMIEVLKARDVTYNYYNVNN